MSADFGDDVDVDDETNDEEEETGDLINNEENGGQICFFCEKERKVSNYRVVPLHSSKDEKLRNDITSVINACDDREIEKKLTALEFHSEIIYHRPCKKTYLKKNAMKPVIQDFDWHKKLKFHELTFADICGFVERNIIINKECHLLQLITDFYNEILEKFYVKEFRSF